MRIARVRIGSYGNLREKKYEFGDGLNAVYGPNEAGKSTLRSFITNTLFGEGSKSPVRYPEKKRSDSGSIDVVMSDGSARTVQRDGKKSVGGVAEDCGIDGNEYTDIYSLQPDGLRNVKNLESGKVRERFLTVPGGRDLPKVTADLRDEAEGYVPPSRHSDKARIATLEIELTEQERRVQELQASTAGDFHYNELVGRRNELTKRIGEKSEENGKYKRATESAAAEKERERSREKIRELRNREARLAYADRIPDDTRDQETGLKNAIEYAKQEAETSRQRAEASEDALGRDADPLVDNGSEIEDLYRSSSAYAEMKRSPRPAPALKSGGGKKALLYVGIVILIAGVAVAALASVIAGVAVAVAGVAVAAVGAVKGRPAPAGPAGTPGDDPRVKELDRRLDAVCEKVGITRTGFERDTATLYELLGKARTVKKDESDQHEKEVALGKAKNDLALFYSGYGGEDGFASTMKAKADLADVRSQLKALDAGASEDEEAEKMDPKEAEEGYQRTLQELTDLNTELGTVNEAIRNIEGDVKVEDAITARSQKENEIYNAVKEWAGLRLQQIILDRATEKSYEGHRPDVVERADRYLSMMTGGRYRINTDPAAEGISVIEKETGEVKDAGKWSTGLEDQIKLAFKLAVSLSLSKERPPVILDDVLLTSDSGRKASAVEAVADLAKEVQVIYFTCDRETRDLLEGAGAKVTEL